ncbi:TPA: excinuclease ABC subunit A [Candidatus Uhrbacteria bacterium]|nr:excinuclease ABC subunit A [Candidatus Uhrbacteria bacterium]
MIQSFGDEDTENLFNHDRVKKLERFERIALRKLAILDAAVSLIDLISPPGNKLEKLQGKLVEYHSIRINDQWRICFIWKNGNAYGAKIVDYH